MKYKYIVFLIVFVLLCFLPNKKYVELNHLKLLHSIEVKCDGYEYEVTLVEVIPLKENNSVDYKYKKYYKKNDSLLLLKKDFDKDYHFFYGGIKSLKTNCLNVDDIINVFSLYKGIDLKK